ncbi:MAG: hypothetical protein J3Q66DRAFT_375408 [Benniella sp.]|nr:MAG: hypothetical protein J3Q66DRAFT_375408 [Benniella sp.]
MEKQVDHLIQDCMDHPNQDCMDHLEEQETYQEETFPNQLSSLPERRQAPHGRSELYRTQDSLQSGLAANEEQELLSSPSTPLTKLSDDSDIDEANRPGSATKEAV